MSRRETSGSALSLKRRPALRWHYVGSALPATGTVNSRAFTSIPIPHIVDIPYPPVAKKENGPVPDPEPSLPDGVNAGSRVWDTQRFKSEKEGVGGLSFRLVGLEIQSAFPTKAQSTVYTAKNTRMKDTRKFKAPLASIN